MGRRLTKALLLGDDVVEGVVDFAVFAIVAMSVAVDELLLRQVHQAPVVLGPLDGVVARSPTPLSW